MLLYELKKVLGKTVNKVALLLLLAALVIVSTLAISGVSYTEPDGSSISGMAAARQLEKVKKQWEGYVTENVLRAAIEANDAVNQSPEYQSDDVTENNMAYSRKQGFSDIREMLNQAFSDFQTYDYFRADSLSPEDAGAFYGKRAASLREWLDSEEMKDQFTENEKQYLIRHYEEMETPVYYTYADGWKTLLTYTDTMIMLIVLVTGFLVSGIFPGEFALKADSVYFSSRFGRNRGVRAKIGAGLLLITVIYWGTMLLYTGIMLFALGAGGGSCVIQTGLGGWKSLYNITFFQKYLLSMLGGYAGSLFILSLAMLISAKTRSAVLAVTMPFIVLFIPSFLSGVNALNKVLGLLPDQLLQISSVINQFNLYELGGQVVGSVPILMVLYSCLCVIMIPWTYRIFHRISER